MGSFQESETITERPGQVSITRFAEALEVLDRDDIFSVRLHQRLMEPLMKGFVLGQDEAEGATREHDLSVLRLAMSREDLPRVRKFTARCVEDTLRAVLPRGRVDVVRELSRPIPARWAIWYFGLSGMDEATLLRWSRALFADVAFNPARDSDIHQEALTASMKFGAWLDARISRQRRWQWLSRFFHSEGVLDRLLEMQHVHTTRLDDVTIRNAIMGSLSGTLDNVSTSVANILDVLLDRPEQLQRARMAALNGDDAALRPYLLEALRFKPPLPTMARYCERNHVLAQGSPHERRISKGSLVVVMVSAAMLDPGGVEAPNEFRTDRPAGTYLHFGAGPHACIGRYLGMVLTQEICKGLLRLQDLRRADGAAGQVKRTRFPESFELVFDTATSAGVIVH